MQASVVLPKTRNGKPIKDSIAETRTPGMDSFLCGDDLGFPFTWEPKLIAKSQAAAPNLPVYVCLCNLQVWANSGMIYSFAGYFSQYSRSNPFKPTLDGFNIRKWLIRLEGGTDEKARIER
jgi:hypothetical protein